MNESYAFIFASVITITNLLFLITITSRLWLQIFRFIMIMKLLKYDYNFIALDSLLAF